MKMKEIEENISEVIYFAQKAILYPTAPIYDSQINALKPECVKALSRIFKLCDSKNSGILSDEEIMKFQKLKKVHIKV